MVRKTREDALATRDNILDCAEALFVRQGVSRTTLQHIADQAGVTRGAIYWHFEDKVAVFNAMMLRVKMPLESAMQRMLDLTDPQEALADLKAYAMLVFRLTETDPRSRRAFEIATMKVEYVCEMTAVQDRRLEMAARWMASAEKRLRTAVEQGQARADTNSREVALGLWAIMDGLLRAWLIAPESFSLSALGGSVIDTYLRAIRVENAGQRPITPA
jgi:TetR/AcrR family acrAB operon transcriptional repressor